MKEQWQSWWISGETPWVGEHVNDVLISFLPELPRFGVPPGAEVLVPLAGDSPAVKILYDAGYEVTAVEYVPEALERLKGEFPTLSFSRESAAGSSYRWHADRLHLHCEDFFEFRGEVAAARRRPNSTPSLGQASSAEGRFAFVYDRAAYVALDADARERYAAVVMRALRPGGILFSRTSELISGTAAGDGQKVEWQGPPYSVTFADVRASFEPLTILEQSSSSNAATQARFLDKGITEIRHLTVIFQNPDVSFASHDNNR